MKIYDYDKFESCEDRLGTYGGQSGYKDSIKIGDDYWIIKYPKNTKSMNAVDISYTTAPLSEYIGSHVYEILGYDVHETNLGIRNHKLVVAVRDFCEYSGQLIEFRTLKNYANDYLAEKLDESFSSTSSSYSIQLEEVLLHLENNPLLLKIDGITERFWNQIVVDSLIGNNDRNNGNWGLLQQKDGSRKLAPVYDNGAAFSNKAGDEKIKKMLDNEERLLSNIQNTVSCYCIDGKRMTFSKLLSYDNDGLKKAIIYNYPLIRDNLGNIKNMIYEIPREKDGIEVCSDVRKDFYYKLMELRTDLLLRPLYEKYTSDEAR